MNKKKLIDVSKKLIPDKILKREISILIKKLIKEIELKENNYQKNIIDPFGSLFEKLIFDFKNNEEWKKTEFQRQLQKTLMNHIGIFHQNLLTSLVGCEEPKEGGVDFICEEKKIVAEIKSKHNTTNADGIAGSFDKISNALETRSDFTGYYVTIIPKKNKNYEKIFVTTKKVSNLNHYRKPNKKILSINGEFFYEKITNHKDILKSIYLRIPDVYSSIETNKSLLVKNIKNDNNFQYYLLKALGQFN